MNQSKHDQMLALVDRFLQTIAREDNPNIIVAHVDDASAMCNALTAALEENATLRTKVANTFTHPMDANAIAALFEENVILRTEKHADAEAIGTLLDEIERLREAFTASIAYHEALLAVVESRGIPQDADMIAEQRDRLTRSRETLK